jgi:hypothetical protein
LKKKKKKKNNNNNFCHCSVSTVTTVSAGAKMRHKGKQEFDVLFIPVNPSVHYKLLAVFVLINSVTIGR